MNGSHLGVFPQLFRRQIRTSAFFNPSESAAYSRSVEIEELLDFSENLLLSAAATWCDSGLEAKQRLQQILFPQGVTYSDGVYRTTVTNPMFNLLRKEVEDKEQLVALTGIEPVF
jgi:hypothetical protein